MFFSWPDGGTTPFHGEKNTSWEGGYRVPGKMRWPGVIKPGTEINEIVSHEDWVPPLVAAAGEPDVKNKLLAGYEAAGKTFKVHLDGYDRYDLLAGAGPSKRKEFFYWTDDGNLAAFRYDRWKILFVEQRAEGSDVWQEPFVTLRLPAQAFVGQHLQSYVAFPPRQKSGSFSLDQLLAKLQESGAGKN